MVHEHGCFKIWHHCINQWLPSAAVRAAGGVSNSKTCREDGSEGMDVALVPSRHRPYRGGIIYQISSIMKVRYRSNNKYILGGNLCLGKMAVTNLVLTTCLI